MNYQLTLPKMGESVSEATIVNWLKQPGDYIERDEILVEIATDKVDSEVPSPVSGKLVQQCFSKDEVAQVGDTIAIIEVVGEGRVDENEALEAAVESNESDQDIPGIVQLQPEKESEIIPAATSPDESSRFYSPLVRNIAAEENISADELASINGSGLDGRVTKQDLLNYLSSKKKEQSVDVGGESALQDKKQATSKLVDNVSGGAIATGQDEIIEMDRMRKLIADHMVHSVHTAPHVCSFVEADVTNIVNWRNKVKDNFEQREQEKITFTPIFIEAVTKALKDFPLVNISVNGTQIIKKKDINIGMAAALPTGNLIVPVIKNADQLNLVGLTKSVNDLANRARKNKLKPDETQGGTFTLTNIGSFGNVMGTPIIPQPQVAILAVGAIKKKPAVIETSFGDVIAIRHMMFLSMSYDHRVVDGALGGKFIRRVADYLEAWDVNRII